MGGRSLKFEVRIHMSTSNEVKSKLIGLHSVSGSRLVAAGVKDRQERAVLISSCIILKKLSFSRIPSRWRFVPIGNLVIWISLRASTPYTGREVRLCKDACMARRVFNR